MACTTHWITYTACGHEAKTQVTHSNARERDRKIAWLGDTLKCPDCEQVERDQLRATVTEARQWLREFDGRTMTGTDKQVAWAEDIRHGMLTKYDTDTHDFRTRGNESTRAAVAVFDEVRDAVAGIESARWWIDHRHMGLYSDIREVVFEHDLRDNLDAAVIAGHLIGDVE